MAGFRSLKGIDGSSRLSSRFLRYERLLSCLLFFLFALVCFCSFNVAKPTPSETDVFITLLRLGRQTMVSFARRFIWSKLEIP